MKLNLEIISIKDYSSLGFFNIFDLNIILPIIILLSFLMISKIHFIKFPLFTFYKRSYYSLNNNRFTMDREMCFKNFNDKGKLLKNFYNLVICEVKSKSSLYNDYLRYLPIRNIRYSKYCEAVRHLNLHA